MSENALLNAALSYAERGWNVFPLHTPEAKGCSCGKPSCNANGKHPRTRQGVKDATKDKSKIRDWWTRWPNANIGIATGADSGLVVLDVDDKGNAKGSASLEALVQQHGAVDTFTVRTGSGKHLFFKHSGAIVRNSVSKVGSGLDVRGDAGYVVAAPSLHANGNTYEVEMDCAVAELPLWVVTDAAGERAEEMPDVVTPPLADAATFTTGTRNSGLFKLACALRGQLGMEKGRLLAIITEYNQTNCDPPLDTSELLSIMKSACNYPAEVGAKKSLKRQEGNPLYWFKFNTRQWFSDRNVNIMTDYQTGWYIRLIAFAWDGGGFLPWDMGKLSRLAKAASQEVFEKDCGDVLADFEEVQVNGEVMLKHPKMAAQYVETLVEWTKKVEAGQLRAVQFKTAQQHAVVQ